MLECWRHVQEMLFYRSNILINFKWALKFEWYLCMQWRHRLKNSYRDDKIVLFGNEKTWQNRSPLTHTYIICYIYNHFELSASSARLLTDFPWIFTQLWQQNIPTTLKKTHIQKVHIGRSSYIHLNEIQYDKLHYYW